MDYVADMNLTDSEKAFHAIPALTEEQGRKAWLAAHLFFSFVEIMNDGPDVSDAMQAQRYFEEAMKLARQLFRQARAA